MTPKLEVRNYLLKFRNELLPLLALYKGELTMIIFTGNYF